ncbi:hypothetical protein PC129_g24107, partial [Phytophthora cactorum]
MAVTCESGTGAGLHSFFNFLQSRQAPTLRAMEPFKPDDTSAKALMASGSQAFNDHLTTKIQAGLGRSLPQMEVRVKNLSVSADVVVGRHED